MGGGGFNPLSIVSDAMNALKDVGQTLEDLGSGNIGKLGQDLGKDFGDITKLGTDVASFTNPELAPFLQMAQPLLGGLAGQAGGFNPMQMLGLPNPFSQGGIPGNIGSDPWGAIGNPFGGSGYGGGGGYGGGVGGGYPAGGYGGVGAGSPSASSFAGSGPMGADGQPLTWQKVQQDVSSAQASGDPMKLEAAVNEQNQYNNFVSMISNLDKSRTDTEKSIIGNLR